MRQMAGAEDYQPGRTAIGIEAVRQRAYHIIDTSPGALPQDPEWGWAIRDVLGQGIEPGDLRTLEAIGREAFKRDPEIDDATVSISPLGAGRYHVEVLLATTLGETTIEADLP